MSPAAGCGNRPARCHASRAGPCCGVRPTREGAMRLRAVLFAATLALAPLTATAADLVIWWEKGYRPEEDTAIRETVAAFEQETHKQVELSLHVQWELPDELQAALKAGSPPDFAFGNWLNQSAPGWASEGRLAELTTTIASLPVALDADGL